MNCKKPKARDEGRIEKVKERYEKGLLGLSNVVGVGIGYKTIRNISTHRLCIKVYVEKKVPESRLSRGQLIPKKVDNVEIDVEETGSIKAL